MKPDSLRRFRRVLPLFASILVIAGCGEPVAQGGAPAVPEVSVVTVVAQPLALTTELAGRTSAYMISEVRPQVGGIVTQRLFDEGSDVQAGETLYEIDPSIYRASFNSAKAALAKAEANLKVVRLRAARYK